MDPDSNIVSRLRRLALQCRINSPDRLPSVAARAHQLERALATAAESTHHQVGYITARMANRLGNQAIDPLGVGRFPSSATIKLRTYHKEP
jgi:hypothetical protein